MSCCISYCLCDTTMDPWNVFMYIYIYICKIPSNITTICPKKHKKVVASVSVITPPRKCVVCIPVTRHNVGTFSWYSSVGTILFRFLMDEYTYNIFYLFPLIPHIFMNIRTNFFYMFRPT
jgi:hypothetical protein